MFPPLPGLELLGDSPPSLSAFLEALASREGLKWWAHCRGTHFLKGLRSLPQPHPKGPLPWGWPIPCLCSSTSNSVGW